MAKRKRKNAWFLPQRETSHHRIVRGSSKPSMAESFMGAKIYRVDDGYTTSIDRDSVHDTLGDAKAFIKSWKTNPAKFDRCVKDVKKSLKRSGRSGTAYAICSAASKKNGRTRIKLNILPLDIWTASMLPGTIGGIEKQREKIARGLKRKPAKAKRNPGNPRNPADAAREAYKGFHGRESEEDVRIVTPIHYHKHTAGMGDVRMLQVITEDGKYRVKVRFRKPYPILSMNEKRTQMFIDGGDQSVDPKAFGISDPHEEEVLGKLERIHYFTTKEHLGDDGGTAIYNHKFGKKEVGGFMMRRKFVKTKRPTVLYDVPNQLISLAGGGYSIPDEGIDG